MEINLLDRYPKAKRNLDQRSLSSPEDRKIAKQFGMEYFDGPRSQGYGGYRYDGRWVPIIERFRDHYQLGAGSKILDVGCAKGFVLHDFMEKIPGIEVRGIDISPYAIENAMEDVKPFIQVANAKDIPFEDNTFDFVISINTIHNLPLEECKQSLREIERVSKGNSFVVVDAYHNEEEKERLLKWNLTAQTYMSVKEWEAVFKEVGFTGDYYWFIP